MKKQILILALFVLAMMAGSLTSFGQLLPSNIVPVPGTCTSDALHPKAGVPYLYTIDNTNGVAPTDYSWWVTKNPEFVVPGTVAPAVPVMNQTSKLTAVANELIATDAYTATGKTISITWTPELLAKTKYQTAPNIAATNIAPSPTFVAVMANGSCTNNLQVYEIDPKPSFTVDISNIDATNATLAYGTDFQQCVDKVRGATYAAAKVVMDYGTNTIYYEIIAANFVTSWKPTFQIMAGSLSASQTADIGYATTLANAKAGTFLEAASTALADGAIVAGNIALTSTIPNTNNGVSIYVKVVIHNNKEESLADRLFTLAVDGQDFTSQWDLINATCVDPALADQNDKSFQTITRRPDVLDNSGPGVLAPSFIIKN